MKPTDKEFYIPADKINGYIVPSMRAALKRWGQPKSIMDAKGRELIQRLESYLAALSSIYLDMASSDEVEYELAHGIATLCTEARAYLAAHPETAAVPTDKQLAAVFDKARGADPRAGFYDALRAVYNLGRNHPLAPPLGPPRAAAGGAEEP